MARGISIKRPASLRSPLDRILSSGDEEGAAPLFLARGNDDDDKIPMNFIISPVDRRAIEEPPQSFAVPPRAGRNIPLARSRPLIALSSAPANSFPRSIYSRILSDRTRTDN